MSRELAAPHPAAGVDPGVGALAELVRSTYAYLPAALAGYCAGIGVVALLFWQTAPVPLLAWGGFFVLVCGARFSITRAYQRAVSAEGDGWTSTDWNRWLQRTNIGTVVSASLWGLSGWLFYPRADGIEQTGLIVIIYTYCAVGIPALSLQRRLYLAFAALVMLPLLVRIAMVGDRDHYLLAGELVLILSFTFVLAYSYRQALQRAVELKLQADELATKLRVETVAAEAARGQAEVANRAKTQFFTAASHDLRQPLHAMGLFAEALRQRVHEPEVAHLVNSINESVDALEGLFSELLDITRIDSGGIDVHPQHFEVGDLLRKLRLNFEPGAFEKGLALKMRGGEKVVFADPLLVERILRNLVSNAIRYTQDGSVLVGCRRRGDRVLLQVWDTGPGIAAAEQARIFDEFYQVPNTPKATPDQRKGLGLGLAIVKRLAELMEAPLTLRSVPGRGTVFTLSLAPGKAPRPSALSMPGAKGPLGITLAGRRIVIVEDEPAVRAGLEVLLVGWGAHIDAFDSVAEARAWAARSDPVTHRPDLLIVDYRLEDGLTGVDAIKALRGRFGSAIPAILVTGSTMTGHDKEAAAHDFHLLIKPVVPNKLRAMIAFKLGVKPA